MKMMDAHLRLRNYDVEDRAHVLALIINNCSFGRKQAITAEEILGRPLKANLQSAEDRATARALEEKDRKRREANRGR